MNVAGSVATFDDNIRRVIRDCGMSLQQAAYMASTGPARSIGLGDRKGVLAGAYDADIVALDQELNVILTMVRGTIAYSGSKAVEPLRA